jgi:DNA polymerase-1
MTTAAVVTTDIAADAAPVLVPAMRRARLDPVAKLLAAADQAGVKFRWEGRVLRVAGTAGLHPDDRELLRAHAAEIKARLAGSNDCADPCEEWGVEVQLVTDATAAEAIVAGLPASVGVDIETAPRKGFSATEQPWLRITRKGGPYKDQPSNGDSIGLDPYRAEPRTVQVYDPAARTVYVFDLHSVPLEALTGLWDRRLVAHNATFEMAMLARRCVHPTDVIDSMQLVGLCLGCAPGTRKLENAVRELLGTEMPKGQQQSAWGAERLSLEQIRYAAADAAAAHVISRKVWAHLGTLEREVFWRSNAVVPIAAAMQIRGVPFDCEVHRGRIEAWETALADARRSFVELTGGEVPKLGPQRRAWLEHRLPDDELARWPRTDAGHLSTKADDMARLADRPEIAALLKVDAEDKKLRDFGRKLVGLVNSGTGRVHPSWMPCGAKTGRFACSNPNMQQLPKKERHAVVAPPGRLFVIADYSQLELRVAAELAREDRMRQVFASGGDLHRVNAAWFAGCSEEQVTEDDRSKAKAVSFGTLFGQGSRGLVQTAWNDWRLMLALEEAERIRAAFFHRYPRLRDWQRENEDRAQRTGLLRSIKGRPLRAEWEYGGKLRWTVCCNYPVQSSAADLVLDAMARVHRALEGFDASLAMQVHDELVVEAAEKTAPEVAELLVEHMTAAWVELFPEAPAQGIVDIRTSPVWAKS